MRSKIKLPVYIALFALVLILGILFATQDYLSSGSSLFINNSVSTVKKSENASSVKTLTYYYGGTDFGNAMEKNLQAFQNANRDIKLRISHLPDQTDYQRRQYQLSFASGNSDIDVLYGDIIWVPEFASSGWILSLDRYNENQQREFQSSILEACKYKNKLFAVPNSIDAPVLYYRTDIISSPPATYAQLMKDALSNLHYPGIKYGYITQAQSYEGLVCNALEFIWNNGGNVTENGKVTINSPEAVEGLQTFADIVNSPVSSKDVLNFQEDDTTAAFKDASCIFMRNWPNVYRQLEAGDSKVKGCVGVAPLPLGPHGKKSTGTLGGWGFMISKNSKNVDAAYRFVSWMSKYETQLNSNTIAGTIPSRERFFQDKQAMKNNPWITSVPDIFDKASARPVCQSYSSISECMQTNFSNAVTEKITAEAAIKNIYTAMVSLYSNS